MWTGSGRLHRYRGLLAVAVLLFGLGVITGSPVLVTAAVIPLSYPLLGAMSTGDPIEHRIEVVREVTPETPLPGQSVEVHLMIKNASDQAITDLRVVDGVPEELGVHAGEARGSGTLRPDDSFELSYTMVPDRGTFQFRPVVIQSHNLLGTVVSTTRQPASGVGAIACQVTVDEVPIARTTTAFTGPLATDQGGPGIEFYATREYRRGDPPKRINWRRYARTGELSTVEYRQQRSARVAIIIDSRQPAHVSAGRTLPTGATLSAYAAALSMDVLFEEGHQLAIGALGTEDPYRGSMPAWASAAEHRAFRYRAASICNASATGAEATVTGRGELVADGSGTRIGDQLRWMLARFSPGTQVLFCSPLVDDESVAIAQTFREAGHAITVLSPDILPESVGGRLLALERSQRLDQLRSTGASAIDWRPDEPLPIAVARTLGAEAP